MTLLQSASWRRRRVRVKFNSFCHVECPDAALRNRDVSRHGQNLPLRHLATPWLLEGFDHFVFLIMQTKAKHHLCDGSSGC